MGLNGQAFRVLRACEAELDRAVDGVAQQEAQLSPIALEFNRRIEEEVIRSRDCNVTSDLDRRSGFHPVVTQQLDDLRNQTEVFRTAKLLAKCRNPLAVIYASKALRFVCRFDEALELAEEAALLLSRMRPSRFLLNRTVLLYEAVIGIASDTDPRPFLYWGPPTFRTINRPEGVRRCYLSIELELGARHALLSGAPLEARRLRLRALRAFTPSEPKRWATHTLGLANVQQLLGLEGLAHVLLSRFLKHFEVRPALTEVGLACKGLALLAALGCAADEEGLRRRLFQTLSPSAARAAQSRLRFLRERQSACVTL